MLVRPLLPNLRRYISSRGLVRKFEKQVKLFEENFRYPSLHTEILEPKSLKIYSFRIDRKYRAIFIINDLNEAEIIDINDHYQ